MAKRAPAGKTKLISLHVDGKRVNAGMAVFLGNVLAAVAHRPTSNNFEGGQAEMRVNANGDLVVYVNEGSV